MLLLSQISLPWLLTSWSIFSALLRGRDKTSAGNSRACFADKKLLSETEAAPPLHVCSPHVTMSLLLKSVLSIPSVSIVAVHLDQVVTNLCSNKVRSHWERWGQPLRCSVGKPTMSHLYFPMLNPVLWQSNSKLSASKSISNLENCWLFYPTDVIWLLPSFFLFLWGIISEQGYRKAQLPYRLCRSSHSISWVQG